MNDDERSSEREVPAQSPLDDARLRELLRASGPRTTPSLLRGVQRKIRERSRGRFYADGWSRAPRTAATTYIITSLLMLSILLLAYLFLLPSFPVQ